MRAKKAFFLLHAPEAHTKKPLQFPKNELVIFSIRDVMTLLTVQALQALLILLTLLTVQALLTVQDC